MKLFLFSFFVLLCGINTHAQNYRPFFTKGKVWHYAIKDLVDGDKSHEPYRFTVAVAGDTVKGGRVCTKLSVTDLQYPEKSFNTVAFEEDGKVYKYSSNDARLYFDFAEPFEHTFHILFSGLVNEYDGTDEISIGCKTFKRWRIDNIEELVQDVPRLLWDIYVLDGVGTDFGSFIGLPYHYGENDYVCLEYCDFGDGDVISADSFSRSSTYLDIKATDEATEVVNNKKNDDRCINVSSHVYIKNGKKFLSNSYYDKF
ncbi:MAG: hypothetical protein K6E54_07250 [Bacteroidaceae bacterium]|nr:hypothetical protein [Bacteroidaceae bacterium]